MPQIEQVLIMHDVLDIDTIYDVDTVLLGGQIVVYSFSNMQEYFTWDGELSQN